MLKGNWLFTHFRPGSDPFYALAEALIPLYTPNLNATERMVQTLKLADYLDKGEVTLTKSKERFAIGSLTNGHKRTEEL